MRLRRCSRARRWRICACTQVDTVDGAEVPARGRQMDRYLLEQKEG
jgi:hypothetical protein